MDIIARLAADPSAWAALAALFAMEVVLGLDNLVFIACCRTGSKKTVGLARSLGLSLALLFRLAFWPPPPEVVRLREPLATFRPRVLGARSPVAGRRPVPGLEGDRRDPRKRRSGRRRRRRFRRSALSLLRGLFQIIVIDIVFSVDKSSPRSA